MSGPSPSNNRHLHAIVFVTGASNLGAEIAVARLLAPYFGASTIIWANTIGTVLLALSVGYWLGGRLADRRPSLDGLCVLLLLAAVLLAAAPLVAAPLLPLASDALASISVGAFVGSLLAILVLAALPVLLLGAVSPYALRLALDDTEHAGTIGGRLYAISTMGSLTGTFASALLLIPFLGTRRTFAVMALSLVLVTLPRLKLRARAGGLAMAIAIVAAVPAAAVKTAGGHRVLHETETAYQYARVTEAPDGTRRLELNEGQAFHSLWRPGAFLVGGYWDDLFVAPLGLLDRRPARVAILGNAAGTVARDYGHYLPATHVDAVELDGELTDIGRRWFGLAGPRLHTITADARPFLRQSGHRYDVILVDAYRQPYIPFYLATREFFEEVRDRLAPGGSVAVNVGHPAGSSALERVLAATMRTTFRQVLRDPVSGENVVLLARTGSGRATTRHLPPDLHPLARRIERRLSPALRGGEVYTDDRAPVEWLVDGSLLRYATG
jgi:spermidine synthase